MKSAHVGEAQGSSGLLERSPGILEHAFRGALEGRADEGPVRRRFGRELSPEQADAQSEIARRCRDVARERAPPET